MSGTGEAHCAGGLDVVLRLLERLDAPTIEVACGRETPLAGDRAFPDAWRAHADDGSGLDLPSTSRQPFAGDAVRLITETADRAEGLRVLTLGPLTNLADALASEPALAGRLESIDVMGGALFVPGNVHLGGPPDNEGAEWNIYVDPASAQAVIDSGIPVRLVSLDGTNQVPLTPEFAERVRAGATGPGALVLAELLAGHPFMTDGTYFLWDPLAAAITAGHPVGSFAGARVVVEEAEGPEAGFTRPVEGTPNVEFLRSADLEAAERVLLDTLNQGGVSTPSAPAGADSPARGSIVIVGRVVTMDQPPVAEALLIEDGAVTAIGTREEVLGRAGDPVPVFDIGDATAYPGFVDAHAHWIGDREYYQVETPAAAMDLALARGWTSISEQWVDPVRLEELEGLAAADALPLRVDAYLALNYDDEFLGDWYASRAPGPVSDHLRVRGVKIHLDDGYGNVVNWQPADLTATIARADEAGWQLSVHAMSSVAVDLVLDAYASAVGPTGPNPLRHRIEHALDVTDEQLDRLVAMDVPVVVQLDGAADWLLHGDVLPALDRSSPGADDGRLTRWRDFVDAGLHVASATDAPWTFPGDGVADDMGRPTGHIAAGMDGRLRTSPESPPWVVDQLLSAEQGLRMVTLDAAYALGDESRRGRLAPGTLGDVTILSGDITSATPDEIRAMTVIATIVDGTLAFCGDPASCARLGGT